MEVHKVIFKLDTNLGCHVIISIDVVDQGRLPSGELNMLKDRGSGKSVAIGNSASCMYIDLSPKGTILHEKYGRWLGWFIDMRSEASRWVTHKKKLDTYIKLL